MPPDDPAAPGALPPGEEALAVDAAVAYEGGRWVVYLDVVLASGAVRRRVGDWPDRGRAQIAAREIQRNAARRLPPPATGGAGATDRDRGRAVPPVDGAGGSSAVDGEP